ncbi:hypothetical protein NIES4103_45740 [Nostoc sp. NIES-4103]|nr:hypothetical protein NIES4103_45740 [Nostoc sp. NIES-4103]
MPKIRGPLCFENWKAKEKAKSKGESWAGISEYPLFSDAHINRETSRKIGPYQLIDAIRITEDPKTPAMILRVEDYYDPSCDSDIHSTTQTTNSRYHGGSLAEEIASLISLCLGIRVKAGLISRGFTRGDELSKIFKTIYKSRSQALHSGVAFPKPMCMPPERLQNNKFAEKPLGSKSVIRTIGGSWKTKDVPLFIHTFEYLGRNILLNWWDSMVKTNTTSS